MKYRSRTDIVSMVLDAANGGATKTKIMYKAYLSYAQLKEYLSVMLENGLIEYVEGERTFRTTAKGLQYQKLYSNIGTMIGNIGTMIGTAQQKNAVAETIR
jgi:predicted transcriptional regulator